MSDFHEVRFPLAIAFHSTGGPVRRTEIVTLGSGHEERNAVWAGSRRSFDVGSGVRTLDDLNSVIAFFEAHPARRPGLEVAGVDRYGADLKIDGARTRFIFEAPQPDLHSLHAVLADCVERHRS